MEKRTSAEDLVPRDFSTDAEGAQGDGFALVLRADQLLNRKKRHTPFGLAYALFEYSEAFGSARWHAPSDSQKPAYFALVTSMKRHTSEAPGRD